MRRGAAVAASVASAAVALVAVAAAWTTPFNSFDHLVGAGQQRRRHLDAERLRGGQIDNQLELGRLLDRKVGGLRPPQNLSIKSPARRVR